MTGRSNGLLSRSPERSASAPRVVRRHARFKVNLPVRCFRVAGRTTEAWRGRTADVSGGGFAIELPRRFPPRTRVAIEVRTGIGPMRMEAEVVWTRRAAGSGGHTLHGLCLAERSELPDLPISILLGEWLTSRARRLATPAPRPTSPRGARVHRPKGK